MSFILHRFKILLLLVLCTHVSLIGNSQLISTKLYYDLEKDKVWIDSIKMMIKRDANYDESGKSGARKQLRYFTNCLDLGLYYEKLFQKKVLPSNTLAIKYYTKVAEHGTFSGEPEYLYYKASALTHTVCRKLAALYFTGKGVKKDRNRSLQLALKGTSGVDGFDEYYSMKYFKTRNIVLDSSVNESSDTFYLRLNPFYYQKGLSVSKIATSLEHIAITFKNHAAADATLGLMIEGYSTTSMLGQARASRLVTGVQRIFVERYGIDSSRINQHVETGNGEDPAQLLIYFTNTFQ